MKRERPPTLEELEKLLAWLASAGRDYVTTHYRLTGIFVARGCIDAETLADEVINRVAVRIDKLIKDYAGDPIKCLQGFADKVYYEYLRDRQKQSNAKPAPATPPDDTETQERENERRKLEDECLAQCMEELTQVERDLCWRYFQHEKRAKINARKKLAAELRLTVNALRIKAHRLRRRLRSCMEACLKTETIRS